MINYEFPIINTKNLAANLHAQGEKSVRDGHPWIFESSIVKISNNPMSGDKVIIFDKKKNKFLGLGLFDPYSPIRIKLLFSGEKKNFDEQWILRQIEISLEKRTDLLNDQTNSFRLIYGENDSMPGLIIDFYSHVAVIKLYSHIWIPFLSWIVNGLIKLSEDYSSIFKMESIVLRLSRALQKDKDELHGLSDGQIIFGTLSSEEIIFKEHGLDFSANVIHGHKTGYFLDHRENRKKVGAFAQNKTVLDVFSYAGGFSVHALAGGAKSVTSIDISKQALEMAKQNASLNGNFKNHITIAEDAFVAMKDLVAANTKFDIVVVDPPSFAKKATETEVALKSYARLARLAIHLTETNGLLIMASCSSRVSFDEFETIITKQLKFQPRKFRLIESTQHDIDHPVSFPEGNYLKCLYFKMD